MVARGDDYYTMRLTPKLAIRMDLQVKSLLFLFSDYCVKNEEECPTKESRFTFILLADYYSNLL